MSKVGSISKVVINGKEIAQTNNLYRTYYIPLDNTVVGQNTIRIVIESTVRETYIRAAKALLPGGVHDFQVHDVWLAPSWVQYARTQASDFGWDWSAAFAP